MRTPLILCPLEIEARAARRAMRDTCDIIRTGPGPDAISRTLDAIDAPPGAVVVLFGTAGGLAPVGVACAATRILDTHANAWTPAPLTRTPRLTIVGMDAPVCKALEKQALARRTDAQVVDCESHAFAHIATARAWKWGVVRGITDDHRTDLPPAIMTWVGPAGRTRPARVAWSMLRDPRLIAESIRLGRSTSRALRAASLLLRQVVDELAEPGVPIVSAES